MNVQATLDQIQSHLVTIAKQGGDKLANEAKDWASIITLGAADLVAGRITKERYGMMLNQARTTMQLNAANLLVEKEAALLSGLQDALLKVAVIAAA